MTAQQFLDCETQQAHPQNPRLQHAWFGLLFWNKQLSNQHYIWFVKLPLDEQGLIVAATRNHFLQIIVDALGQELELAEQKGGQLPDNPYTFTPAQQQLADFNAMCRNLLGLGHSEHMATAMNYLTAPHTQDWQQVPLQGLADAAASVTEDAVLDVVQRELSNYAPDVQVALLTSFENHTLLEALEISIQTLLINQPTNAALWIAGLRSLTLSKSQQRLEWIFDNALRTSLSQHPDILIVIGGRLWPLLENEKHLRLFIEQVAALDEHHQLFAPIFSDLVQIPSLRNAMLAMLRWPEKSKRLTKAVGDLFANKG